MQAQTQRVVVDGWLRGRLRSAWLGADRLESEIYGLCEELRNVATSLWNQGRLEEYYALIPLIRAVEDARSHADRAKQLLRKALLGY